MKSLGNTLQVHVDFDDNFGFVRESHAAQAILHNILHRGGGLDSSIGTLLDQ